MTDGPRLTSAKQQDKALREARLAKALRDNLQRRKERTRQRAAEEKALPTEAQNSASTSADRDPPG
jgi:hypothetical protein